MTWDDIAAQAAAEKPDDRALILLDDPLALRVAVAWSRIPMTRPKRPAADPWSGVMWDHSVLAAAARVARDEAREIVVGLRALRLIWPDGSTAPVVADAAMRQLAQRGGGTSSRTKQQQSDSPSGGAGSYHVLVECADEPDQLALLEKLQTEGRACRGLIS